MLFRPHLFNGGRSVIRRLNSILRVPQCRGLADGDTSSRVKPPFADQDVDHLYEDVRNAGEVQALNTLR